MFLTMTITVLEKKKFEDDYTAVVEFEDIELDPDDIMCELVKDKEAVSVILEKKKKKENKKETNDEGLKKDMMIAQAATLLDNLDKDINTCTMRVKEW